MIVPFAAGGPTDIIARLAAESMSKTLGQQVIIENVAGAGGTTGSARATTGRCTRSPAGWSMTPALTRTSAAR